MSVSFGSAMQYRLLVVAGPGELFRPEDVVGMPTDEFGPGYLPLFTADDLENLLPEWIRFLTTDIQLQFETPILRNKSVLDLMTSFGATHVALNPRPDRPGQLIPITDFVAGLTDQGTDTS